jgi:hypothetical protein
MLRDGRGRFLSIEAHPHQLKMGQKDLPTTQSEAHAVIIDALLDYHKADEVSFWRTMEKRGIFLLGKGLPTPPDIRKLLCPRCGKGNEHDALCPRCDKELMSAKCDKELMRTL